MAVMPGDGAIIIRDIVGKVDLLNVECDKCAADAGVTTSTVLSSATGLTLSCLTGPTPTARGSRRGV